MENLTHSLVGGLLAQTRLGKQLPYTTPVLVIAANLPDIDVIWASRGGTEYLEAHRGITHSVVGIISLAVIFSGICWFALRRFRKGQESAFPGFGTVFWPIFAALVTHPILDWTNNYGIRPWLPFSNHWYYGDIVVVVDPWLWLILGGTLFVIASKTRLGIAAWAVLTIILSFVIFTGLGGRVQVPHTARIVWVIGLAIVAAAKVFAKPTQTEPVAVFGLSLMVIYWAALFAIHLMAVAYSTDTAEWIGRPMKVSAYPMPADPIHWMCIGETPDAIYQVNAFAFSGADWKQATRLPKEVTPEMLSQIQTTEAGRAFLSFARTYSSKVISGADENVVQLRDLRFGLMISAKFDKDFNLLSVNFGLASGR
ncbi:MAG TPA: metal-dependent hydrolase [Blastocatellia bacterium]|nr:metal-dependent hydrolase [Blastocatellia bacterium]